MTGPVVLHPARPGPRAMAAEDLWALPRVGAPVPSPNGRRVAVPVTTQDLEANEGRSRLWLLPGPGQPGRARPLTAPEVSSDEPAWSPDGTRLAFTRKGPDGKLQLHVLPVDGGEARRVTDLPLGVFDPRWLPDGRHVVMGVTLLAGHLTPGATRVELDRRAKDPVKAHVTEARVYRYWDTWLTTGEVPHLCVVEVATGALRDLTPDATWWFDWMEPAGQYDIAPDGSELAFAATAFDEARQLLRSAIYLVPLEGGPVRCLTPDHPADDLRPRYAPDGSTLVYGSQRDPFFYADRVRLHRYDRAADRHTPWLADWPLSPAGWEWASDGTLVFLAEEAGRVSLFARRGEGAPARLVRGGTVRGVAAAAGGTLAFTLETLVEPPEVHACRLDGSGLARLSHFTEPARAAFATGAVEEWAVTGAEGEPVHLYVVRPSGGEAPWPLVQVVHGGPHGVTADGFSWRWNPHVLAAPGYVVALVNFQGSTSWGQAFAQRIQGAWGDRPARDVLAATDALVEVGLADPARLAAAGGSYGGYLVAWLGGQTDRFRCLVNHAGVFDLLSDYASDVTQGAGRAFGAEAWEDLSALDRWNPARFARGMRTPMLVTHGEQDFRVTVNQGLQCYGLLQAKGVPTRLVYFPDEGHWIRKPRNARLWYREVQAWLARFLT